MSQGPLTIADGSGLAVLAAINDALARLATMASGTSRPADIAAGECWRETDNPGGGIHSIWLYDGASDVLLFTLNTSTHAVAYTSAGLDGLLGSTQGMFAYRNASAWVGLAPGSDAYKVPFSGGPGANPAMAGTWKVLGEATPAGAGAVDFISIPAGVHHLMLQFELLPATNDVLLGLQTYGADGVLDVGGSDYNSVWNLAASNPSQTGSATNTTYANLTNPGNGITNNSSSGGVSGHVYFPNIQAARYTRGLFQTIYGPDAFSSLYLSMVGALSRVEADRITGVRLVMTSGNLSGRAVLLGMSG